MSEEKNQLDKLFDKKDEQKNLTSSLYSFVRNLFKDAYNEFKSKDDQELEEAKDESIGTSEDNFTVKNDDENQIDTNPLIPPTKRKSKKLSFLHKTLIEMKKTSKFLIKLFLISSLALVGMASIKAFNLAATKLLGLPKGSDQKNEKKPNRDPDSTLDKTSNKESEQTNQWGQSKEIEQSKELEIVKEREPANINFNYLQDQEIELKKTQLLHEADENKLQSQLDIDNIKETIDLNNKHINAEKEHLMHFSEDQLAQEKLLHALHPEIDIPIDKIHNHDHDHHKDIHSNAHDHDHHKDIHSNAHGNLDHNDSHHHHHHPKNEDRPILDMLNDFNNEAEFIRGKKQIDNPIEHRDVIKPLDLAVVAVGIAIAARKKKENAMKNGYGKEQSLERQLRK